LQDFVAGPLGRRRSDIPLLIVEGRGTARSLASCGLDLERHPNLHVMAHTRDPREFWGVTRLCLMPSLWRENQPLVAIEAMLNGIPVIGSDRGSLPETLGAAGIVLPLPDRMTPVTRILPTPEEVSPWVETIAQLWDHAGEYAERRKFALAEARRWDPGRPEPLYDRFFEDLGMLASRPQRDRPACMSYCTSVFLRNAAYSGSRSHDTQSGVPKPTEDVLGGDLS
jgi:hypothetical protein